MTKANKVLLAVVLTGVTGLGAFGGSLLSNSPVSAQEASPPIATSAPQKSQGAVMGDKTTHIGTNGVQEELLTGDTAEKVKQAALAAVPGGTIQRVETDAEGSPYEAHMSKSDGSRVTVKVDNNFKVTTIEEGGGHGPK